MLTIYIDFKSPASYLAFEPTLALIEETGVEAQWLPFSSRPFKIPIEQSDETVGERHRRVRAIAQRDTHLHYADVQGVKMQFAEQPAGSDASLAALAVLAGNPVPFMRAAFKAYWAEARDLNDKAIVAQLLSELGKEEPDWTAAEEQLELLHQKAEGLKVFETPTYLIDGQMFLGREHLPWIRQSIANRKNTTPKPI